MQLPDCSRWQAEELHSKGNKGFLPSEDPGGSLCETEALHTSPCL